MVNRKAPLAMLCSYSFNPNSIKPLVVSERVHRAKHYYKSCVKKVILRLHMTSFSVIGRHVALFLGEATAIENYLKGALSNQRYYVIVRIILLTYFSHILNPHSQNAVTKVCSILLS